jgi:hypothetical protein
MEVVVLRGPLHKNIERDRGFELRACAGDFFDRRHGSAPFAVGIPPGDFHHISAHHAGFDSAFLHAHHIGRGALGL